MTILIKRLETKFQDCRGAHHDAQKVFAARAPALGLSGASLGREGHQTCFEGQAPSGWNFLAYPVEALTGILSFYAINDAEKILCGLCWREQLLTRNAALESFG